MRLTLFKVVCITFLSFGICFYLDTLYFNVLRQILFEHIGEAGISHILTYIISGVPIYIGLLVLHRTSNFWNSLGLHQSFLKGLSFGIICTLPMVFGFMLQYDVNGAITMDDILISCVSAAFFEEIFFRGFLFGQLYRFTKLGFLPSIITGSLLFGIIHLYQSKELFNLLGIFITTFLGAVLFAWVFVEWKNNIWMPIFLHFFMNIFWMIFNVGENALGSVYPNIFRILSIILIISLTLIYKNKYGLHLEISRKTLWLKK